MIETQRTEGEAAVGAVADAAREKGLDVRTSVRHGKPAAKILEYVDEAGVDAVVMGTHGRSGAGRLVVGSVAETVVPESPVPAMTVRISDD